MFVNFSMHRILLYILLTTSLFAKDIIAVLDLESVGLTSEEAKILTQRLTTKLISLDKYQVVERTNMDKILKEQKFQHSGCTDSECAVEIGQLLNTDFIVIGSVSKFSSMYSLDARLIDVSQGKSLISAEFSIIGEIEVLMSSGITSIANQLCGLEGASKIDTETDKQKQVPPRVQKILGSPGESVKDIEGNTYKTVKIGEQLWMAENLKTTHYKNGDEMPTGLSSGMFGKWVNTTSGAYTVYDNVPSNTDVYGNLYNWYAVDDERGICPEGFHIPSEKEWKKLEIFLGMSEEKYSSMMRGDTDEGSKLAGNADLWNDGNLKNISAFGTSGFNALPAGYRSRELGRYTGMGKYGIFWSSGLEESRLWCRNMYYNHSRVMRVTNDKRMGLSVRCVVDY